MTQPATFARPRTVRRSYVDDDGNVEVVRETEPRGWTWKATQVPPWRRRAVGRRRGRLARESRRRNRR